MPLLEVKDVTCDFPIRGILGRAINVLRAVDGVSFAVEHAEVLGIVGETGSGKSTLAKIITGIQPPTAGTVAFSGETIAGAGERPQNSIRSKLQYVYQDPRAALNPRWTLRRSLHEPLLIHGDLPAEVREVRIRQLAASLELPLPLLDRYPHEVSGGQQRRAGLARILILSPEMVIFDEPTSGLDALVQASVLKLLRDLQRRFELTYVLITHDISVVRSVCDRVAVMNNGKLVEIGSVEQVLSEPSHPYTRSLLASIPRIGSRRLTDT